MWGLDSVSVSYGRRAALESVTVPAGPARITVVVGADGAGKSTALRALVGLVRPDRGEVSRPPKTKIGYLPATAGLWQDLTVQENLAFAAGAYGIDGTALAERLPPILQRIGLAMQIRAVQNTQLIEHHSQRPPVGHDVMHRNREGMIGLAQPEKHGAKWRSHRQPERTVGILAGDLGCSQFSSTRG